jgi:DNA-binding response OmpR family regulator
MLSVGGVEFLQKPFSPDEMMRKINFVMAKTP